MPRRKDPNFPNRRPGRPNKAVCGRHVWIPAELLPVVTALKTAYQQKTAAPRAEEAAA